MVTLHFAACWKDRTWSEESFEIDHRTMIRICSVKHYCGRNEELDGWGSVELLLEWVAVKKGRFKDVVRWVFTGAEE